MTTTPPRTPLAHLADLEAVAAGSAPEPLVLAPAGLVATREIDADLVARGRTGVAVAAAPRPGAPDGGTHGTAAGRCVVDGGRVVAVGTAVHGLERPGHVLVGPLVVAPADVPAARAAISAAASQARVHGWAVDPFDLAVLALIRSGLAVTALPTEPFVVGRATDDDARADLVARAAAQDVVAARWRRATRGDDGFVSTLLLRPVSRRLSPLAVRAGLSPNALTGASLALALLAAVAFGTGERGWVVLGVLVALLSIVLDCADGEVARFTRRFSRFGAWFDAVTDRVKELALLLGLAVGAVVPGTGDSVRPWVLAAACLAAQTVRHASRFAFVDVVLEPTTAPMPDRRPLAETDPPALVLPARRPPGAGLRALTPGQWVRRVLQAPVSERYAALAVGVLGWGAEGGLVGYLALALVSLGWTSAGWLRRTVRLAGDVDAQALHALRDDGVLGRRGGSARASRWSWLLVPAATALEGALAVVAVAAVQGQVAASTLLVVAVLLGSWRRYEVAYGASGAAGAAGPGWPLRASLLAAVAAAAATGWAGGATGLAAVLVAWQGASAVVPGVRAGLAARHDPGDR